MILYVTLAMCFLPLLAGIVFSAVKVPSFKLSYSVWAVGAGFAALVPIIVIQFVIRRFFNFSPASLAAIFLSALLFNGLIEETVKAVFLFLLPVKAVPLSAFTASAIIAGTAVGSFEALVYCIAGTNYSPVRLITAVVLHALCSALSGIFVWTRKNGKARAAALVSATVCHGLYDFFASFNGLVWWFSIAVLLFAAVRLRYYYTDLQRE
ncbi:MAG: PrsW family glutamic-type intramembrane protease [Treponema maltophilum]